MKEFSGEVSLISDREVELNQLFGFADSWIKTGNAPLLNCQVDEVLHGKRNAWVPKLRVSVNTNYSAFINKIRELRDETHSQMQELFQRWAAEKQSFEVVCAREASSFGRNHVHGFFECARHYEEASRSADPEKLFEVTFNPSNILVRQLSDSFQRNGVAESRKYEVALEFLLWEGLAEMPSNKVAAYLFAAIARKASSGQKRPPTRGMVNDIRMISSYAPYVDAMFIDNECAAYLSEEPLRSELKLKARIFCPNTRDEFLSYLNSLEKAADPVVIKRSGQLYGPLDTKESPEAPTE